MLLHIAHVRLAPKCIHCQIMDSAHLDLFNIHLCKVLSIPTHTKKIENETESVTLCVISRIRTIAIALS